MNFLRMNYVGGLYGMIYIKKSQFLFFCIFILFVQHKNIFLIPNTKSNRIYIKLHIFIKPVIKIIKKKILKISHTIASNKLSKFYCN